MVRRKKPKGFVSAAQRKAVMAILRGRKLPLRKALLKARRPRTKRRFPVRLKVHKPEKARLRRPISRVPYTRKQRRKQTRA